MSRWPGGSGVLGMATGWSICYFAKAAYMSLYFCTIICALPGNVKSFLYILFLYVVECVCCWYPRQTGIIIVPSNVPQLWPVEYAQICLNKQPYNIWVYTWHYSTTIISTKQNMTKPCIYIYIIGIFCIVLPFSHGTSARGTPWDICICVCVCVCVRVCVMRSLSIGLPET